MVIRPRIAPRPAAGGKTLLEVPGYRFQTRGTNLPRSMSALNVWRQYHGRADLENRIRELGEPFGIKRLCLANFWARRRCLVCPSPPTTRVGCDNGGSASWKNASLNTFALATVRHPAQRTWWRDILPSMNPSFLLEIYATGSFRLSHSSSGSIFGALGEKPFGNSRQYPWPEFFAPWVCSSLSGFPVDAAAIRAPANCRPARR